MSTTTVTHTFQAVWPILEGVGSTNLTDAELIEDAMADLPNVAARHGVHITGKPQAAITHGQQFRGLGGAKNVVIIEATAKPLATLLGATA